jgi:hypothetical protein
MAAAHRCLSLALIQHESRSGKSRAAGFTLTW